MQTNLFLFIKSLPEHLIRRIKREQVSKSKWYHKQVSAEHTISVEDRVRFVCSLKDIVFTAIFSKAHQSNARKAFQYLTFLDGKQMLPGLVDKLNESFNNLVEPFRYTSLLSCMTMVARELVAYRDKDDTEENDDAALALALEQQQQQQHTQLYVLPLIVAILPGLDPNDSNKCVLTLQLLTNVLGNVLLCDCSPALLYRTDLSEHERQLCTDTAKFEDFIHELFKRVFYIVEYLASDHSSDSSASAAAASTQFSLNNRNKSTNENYYQAHMINTMRVLISQSSDALLTLMLNKMRNYIASNTYNQRPGRILAHICGYLTLSVST